MTQPNSTTAHRKDRAWWWVPTLYFAEGLPYMAVMTISTVMYKCLGISNTELAFFTAWLYLPWVVKPFWSPFVDIIRTKRWWVITMQWIIAIAMAAIAFVLPASGFFSATLAIFWLMAFASATHDIAADGFYMLGLTEHRQSMFVGIRSLFYRISMVVGQGALVIVAAYASDAWAQPKAGWILVFAILAAFFAGIALYHSAILPRPAADSMRDPRSGREVMREFADTFVEFFRKPQVGTAILFMLLYRLPEAQLVKMITPFMLDPVENGGLGLTADEVGWVYGTIGVIGLMLGGIVGGLVAARNGLRHWLHPMAWSMSLTCLTFVYLAFVQPAAIWQVYACVFIEQFGYGFGFTAYMLYLIYFSAGRFKTAHYSICTGFMALGMMLPGMAAGWIADTFSYTSFFIWTMVCCIATISVCYLIKVDPEFGKKNS
ncbi:MAG: AmpG family muropeptide MFS transporter [Bacteroidales bacterium]|nr:AmpG family muropeptide MFS transporter [Bacteroidales bacterium]